MAQRSLKLDTPKNVRKALSKIANMTIRGEIDPKVANSFTVTCNAILGSIRIDEQDAKIEELERRLDEILSEQ